MTSKAEHRRLLRDHVIVARCSGHKLTTKDKEKALIELAEDHGHELSPAGEALVNRKEGFDHAGRGAGR